MLVSSRIKCDVRLRQHSPNENLTRLSESASSSDNSSTVDLHFSLFSRHSRWTTHFSEMCHELPSETSHEDDYDIAEEEVDEGISSIIYDSFSTINEVLQHQQDALEYLVERKLKFDEENSDQDDETSDDVDIVNGIHNTTDDRNEYYGYYPTSPAHDVSRKLLPFAELLQRQIKRLRDTESFTEYLEDTDTCNDETRPAATRSCGINITDMMEEGVLPGSDWDQIEMAGESFA